MIEKFDEYERYHPRTGKKFDLLVTHWIDQLFHPESGELIASSRIICSTKGGAAHPRKCALRELIELLDFYIDNELIGQIAYGPHYWDIETKLSDYVLGLDKDEWLHVFGFSPMGRFDVAVDDVIPDFVKKKLSERQRELFKDKSKRATLPPGAAIQHTEETS